MEHRIARVEEGSIAEELEIEKGDVLLKVNGDEVEDVFDWRDLQQSEELVILVRKPSGEEWELEIEKDAFEDLGIVFENDLMSDYRSCSNSCVFCFIDQMPKGMRETLYFKDDDSRLSFLQGNYITLTNMKQKDVDRIIHYRLEPMNISVHTTNPELRKKMLHNRFAGDVLKYLDQFYEAGLHMNGQIVLCKGLNDREELDRTLSDLFRYLPNLESLSVVPVGLSKYREGLYPLEILTREDAAETIDIIEKWQGRAYDKYGIHFCHASDELYLTAGREFPEEERYDGYLQIENGVGGTRLLLNEAAEALKNTEYADPSKKITLATGLLAAPILERIRQQVLLKFPDAGSRIIGIRNDFFGPNITVAGLITGQDLITQLKGEDLGDFLLLPNVMFRSGEEVMLDDVTRTDVEQALGVKTLIVSGSGKTLIHALTGCLAEEDIDKTHGRYELPSL